MMRFRPMVSRGVVSRHRRSAERGRVLHFINIVRQLVSLDECSPPTIPQGMGIDCLRGRERLSKWQSLPSMYSPPIALPRGADCCFPRRDRVNQSREPFPRPSK